MPKHSVVQDGITQMSIWSYEFNRQSFLLNLKFVGPSGLAV